MPKRKGVTSCKHCGSEFDMRRSKKFCSSDCRWAWHNAQKRTTSDKLTDRQILNLVIGEIEDLSGRDSVTTGDLIAVLSKVKSWRS